MKTPWPSPPSLRLVLGRVSRTRRKRRAVGVLALLVFLGGWGVDAGGFHTCPHHEPNGVAEAHGPIGAALLAKDTAPDPGEPEPGLHVHGDSANSGHFHDEHSDSEVPSHSEHDGPCTCRGDCNGAAPVRPATAPNVERTPPALPVRSVGAAPLILPARFHLPHILPWPTAPPRA
jgi:hypothetical protein